MNLCRRILMLLYLVCVCAQHTSYAAELWVSDGFGRPPIFQEVVDVKGRSVMDLLRDHTDLGTGHGGGFVTSIEGIPEKRSRQDQRHWFYYVNGLLAHKGALEYYPGQEDVIWWVFSEWASPAFLPSVIGSYPQPFQSGYADKIPKIMILYEDLLHDEAALLADQLRVHSGQDILRARYDDQAITTQHQMMVILASWPTLALNKELQAYQKHAAKTGFFVIIENERIDICDLGHQKRQVLGPSGLLLSLRHHPQLHFPIWLMTGTDLAMTKKIVQRFLEQSEDFRWMSGAALDAQGTLHHVPYVERNP